MRRVIPNILEDIDSCIRVVPTFTDSASGFAYGAEILGRAIGHESTYEQASGIDFTLFYTNLVWEVIDHPSHRIMAFQATREV